MNAKQNALDAVTVASELYRVDRVNARVSRDLLIERVLEAYMAGAIDSEIAAQTVNTDGQPYSRQRIQQFRNGAAHA